jgi:hypothetical protein
MRVANFISFDDPRARDWLKAGLFPVIVTINGFRCVAYIETTDGLIYGKTEAPCLTDAPVLEIQYTNSDPLKMAAFMATLENMQRLDDAAKIAKQ